MIWAALVALCAVGLLGVGGCDDGQASDPQTTSADGEGLDGTGDGVGEDGEVVPPPSVADLRVDTNRDGTASLTDPADDLTEGTWTASAGAIVLANIDDDDFRCPTLDAGGDPLPDDDLAACNDAQDEAVNGDADALDLAPVVVAPWADAPADARGTLLVTPKGRGRLFRQRANGDWVMVPEDGALTAEDLRAGLTLGLEATGLPTDDKTWDGTLNVTLQIDAQFTGGVPAISDRDNAQAKVAPMILHHHLEPATRLWASLSSTGGTSANPVEQRFIDTYSESVTQFQADLNVAATAAQLKDGLELLDASPYYEDPWTQDLFETAWASMPGPDGKPQMMTLVLRTASENRDLNPFDPAARDYPLRMASRVVFEQFRSPGVGGVQVFDPDAPPDLDTLDSHGNLDTIPPHTDPTTGQEYPHGRVLIGSVRDYASDPAVRRFLESQAVQAPLYVDTSWLLVGHVDEFLSFLPADNDRGWVLLKFDSALAIKMLEDARDAGHGDAVVFEGFTRFIYPEQQGQSFEEVAADVTINDLLNDPDIMAASAAAGEEANTQAQHIIDAVGLPPEDVIRVPFVMEEAFGQFVAHGPGTVNGVLLKAGHFASPSPHSPIVEGKDLWGSYLEETLAAAPINTTVHWVEDWYSYHINYGEVHCGTNTLRQTSEASAAWWTLSQPAE